MWGLSFQDNDDFGAFCVTRELSSQLIDERLLYGILKLTVLTLTPAFVTLKGNSTVWLEIAPLVDICIHAGFVQGTSRGQGLSKKC